MLAFFYVSLGLIYFLYIINRVQKKKMPERESLIWLIFGVIILILSIFPEIIITASQILGISYAPTLLFLLSILCITFILLRKEEKIAELNLKVDELAKRIALLENQQIENKR